MQSIIRELPAVAMASQTGQQSGKKKVLDQQTEIK